MEIITFLIPMALLLGAFFVGAFIWMTMKGQYDDLDTPGHRMLLDEHNKVSNNQTIKGEEGEL